MIKIISFQLGFDIYNKRNTMSKLFDLPTADNVNIEVNINLRNKQGEVYEAILITVVDLTDLQSNQYYQGLIEASFRIDTPGRTSWNRFYFKEDMTLLKEKFTINNGDDPILKDMYIELFQSKDTTLWEFVKVMLKHWYFGEQGLKAINRNCDLEESIFGNLDNTREDIKRDDE